MLFGAATTAQIAGWQSNARRVGTASTNASLTWTATGATTSTTQQKFGTASERLTTISQYIASANTTIGGMGTTDFTIECFIWLDGLSSHSQSCDVYSHDTSFGFGFRLAQSYQTGGLSSTIPPPKYLNVFARGQADLDYWTLPSNWSTGTWNFVVIQRKSGIFTAWLNGSVLPKSNASSSYNFDTATAPLRIGAADNTGIEGLGASNPNYAYIDEFCISNTYRYDNVTAPIPVPTAAFTVDSYTVQLMHMDGTNGGTTFTNATS
jgi:hypothetical protein